jgi:heptosyltransferase II
VICALPSNRDEDITLCPCKVEGLLPLQVSKSRSRFYRPGDYLVYLGYRLIAWLLLQIPLRWTFRLGQVVGLFGYLILAKYRKLASINLRIAFPEWTNKEVGKKGRAHFRSVTANLLCSVVLTQKPEEADACIDISPLLAAAEKIKAAPGVIWVINHIGNWELFILTPRWLKHPLWAVIYQKLSNQLLDKHVQRSRESWGVLTIDRTEGLHQGVTILRNKGMLGILIDQHAGDKGVWTPFFGRLASTTPFPAVLAKKTGAALMPVSIVTTGIARWRVEVEDFIPSQGVSSGEITARINLSLERQIRKNPSDWFWVHNRWKTPNPQFLLRHYHRGVYVPAQAGRLKPFRVLILSSRLPAEAAMSVEAARRIKRGRPDLRLSVLVVDSLADSWRNVPEVDEVLPIELGSSVFAVARQIRDRFDVAILFPSSVRSAIEIWLAGIPRRVGFSIRWRDFFVNQFVRHRSESLSPQENGPLRIAERIGADLAEKLPLLFVADPP